MTILIRLIKSSILMLRLRAKEHFMPLFYPMSKTFRLILLSFSAVVQIFSFFYASSAQDIEVTIRLDAAKPEIVTIEGKRNISAVKNTSRNLSFLTSITGQAVSGERISNLKLFDSKGAAVGYKRFIPGEYVAETEFVGWNYQIDLSPPKDQKLMARVSWITNTGGALMLSDILPQFAKSDHALSANLILNIPSDWPFTTSQMGQTGGVFFFPDIHDGIIYVGTGWDCHSMLDSLINRKSASISTCFFGEFAFDRSEAARLADKLYRKYTEQIGDVSLRAIVATAKFPSEMGLDIWEAEARGRNITILTSDTSFKPHALQQFHEQLRHEMFHLWIPNGVNLTGNYDWFYEGFALYQSLKIGVALNRIRFDDYLDTLSRAYDIDKRLGQKLSLIDVSKNRWAGDNNTRVYARGMLVAFLCDLALLEKSKGKRSVTDILRKLYEKHRPPSAETDGNTAVLSLLRSYTELTPVIDRNITGSESVDWSGLINAAGLKADSTIQTTALKVISKPSGRQKDLLDKLGYNNWRKLSSK